MQIEVTPAVENQLRARKIFREDIEYAAANPSYDIPVQGMRGVRQLMANIGKGRLFLKYSKLSESQGRLVEGYWDPSR